MEKLFNKHIEKIERVPFLFNRTMDTTIHWDERLIGITGQRGVGKTTFLLQHIRKNFKTKHSALYVSMDDLFFTNHTLYDLADTFIKNGGKHLFIDEIHRYFNWIQEIKLIYDDFPDLHVVFTGSSLLQLRTSKGDLSRRAAFYKMNGLSLREYINFILKTDLPIIPFNELLKNHQEICHKLKKEIKPLVHFKEYIRVGYFPYFIEYPKTFSQRVEEVINITIDVDLMSMKGLNTTGIAKLKQLLYIIAQSVPFKPNISTLSAGIGVDRNTLISYLNHLDEAGIIKCLYSSATGLSAMKKPEKIYLENTCFNFALCEENPNIGTLRETFFLSQFPSEFKLTYTANGDFIINGKFHFEVGGQNKTDLQIKKLSNAFIAADDIEVGFKNKIPLWLFGFLY